MDHEFFYSRETGPCVPLALDGLTGRESNRSVGRARGGTISKSER